MHNPIELLAPARDLSAGKLAVNYGADAVYIGANRFGARQNAHNSVEDIAALTTYAHRYQAKVYVAFNTLIYNQELQQAQTDIERLYHAGVDALIIQDMGILELDIPPITLHASTQVHNIDPKHLLWLEAMGFQRVILARELSLDQIQNLRSQTHIELETFVHGALCVSYSGRCYMSHSQGLGSANRGSCAQLCRLPYDLYDADGQCLKTQQHLLSLKDLNLSQHLNKLIQAGVCSFKIEGRLKDDLYVQNSVAYYRQALDAILENSNNAHKSSLGHTHIDFIPDPNKTFQRGFTDYFFNGRQKNIYSPLSPKSIGTFEGTVAHIQADGFKLDRTHHLNNGDGLCFIDSEGLLNGVRVNEVVNDLIKPLRMEHIQVGTEIYRNYHIDFERQVERDQNLRRLRVSYHFQQDQTTLSIQAVCENNCQALLQIPRSNQIPQKPSQATIEQQLSKLGTSPFVIDQFNWNQVSPDFYPIQTINQWRRDLVDQLEQNIEKLHEDSCEKRRTETAHRKHIYAPYPVKDLDYHYNIANQAAHDLYHACGVEHTDDAYELKHPNSDHVVMQTKHCLKYALGACKIHDTEPIAIKEPLYLCSKHQRFRLEFDCAQCLMHIITTHQ